SSPLAERKILSPSRASLRLATLVSPLHLWRGAGGEENSFIIRLPLPDSLRSSPFSACGEGPGERTSNKPPFSHVISHPISKIPPDEKPVHPVAAISCRLLKIH